MQARYVRDTGVKELRIQTNRSVGYHVEVPTSGAKALGPGFTLRRGLASSTRFSAPELDALAAALEDASGWASAAEQVAFAELRPAVLVRRGNLAKVACVGIGVGSARLSVQ